MVKRIRNFLRRLHIADLICKLCFRNCLHDRAKQYHTLRKIIIHILLQNIDIDLRSNGRAIFLGIHCIFP